MQADTISLLLKCCAFLFCSPSQQEIGEQWNMREKGHLIEAIENNEPYKGMFYDSHHWIAHEIKPGENENYSYTRFGQFYVYSCTYEGASAEEVVAEIMANYVEPDDKCSKFTRTYSEVDSTLNFEYLKYIGQKDGRLLALTEHRNREEEAYYQLRYLNQQGIGERVNDKKYSKTYQPLFINDEKELLLKNNKAYLKNKKKTFELPAESGSLTSFIMNSEYLYAVVGNDDRLTDIVQVSLKNGKYEILIENGATPRLYDENLYFYRPTYIDNKEAWANAGLFKKGLKNGKLKQLVDLFEADELGFQGISTSLYLMKS